MIDTDEYEKHYGMTYDKLLERFKDLDVEDYKDLLAETKQWRGVIYDAFYVIQTDGWNKNRADAINRLEKVLSKGWEGEVIE